MSAEQWAEWLRQRATNVALPLAKGARYRLTVAPVKNKPELSFELSATFDRALTQLLFVDDNGRELRINAATITAIEEES